MATIADTRCTVEFIEALRSRGMEGVRINSAHVDPATFRRMVETIRSVDPDLKILLDTKGPEIRTTGLETPVTLKAGQEIDIRSGLEDSTAGCIRVAVESLERYVRPGGEVLIDDGDVRLEITGTEGALIHCRAIDGGTVGSHKTVAFPGTDVPPLPAVSERDRTNILAAMEAGIDIIAHSFVRTAADVTAVRAITGDSPVRVYAKVECREALENIDGIIAVSDGLLTARGDLGTHIPLPEIPAAQLLVARKARRAGKPLILATQIMQSMISRPMPTRAELSDITLAVMEGYDWLLLTGETAQGEYPRECIDFMRKTIEQAENNHLRCTIN